jgi:hypothetical protein
MFASLPLPDVGASLEELDYALDTLKADGVVLMSNFADRYLGDPAFAPVFDRLNARKAVVFVHPTTCRCGLGVLPNNPPAMIEYPHDTTRTITDLLFSGTFARCPDIKFIFFSRWRNIAVSRQPHRRIGGTSARHRGSLSGRRSCGLSQAQLRHHLIRESERI